MFENEMFGNTLNDWGISMIVILGTLIFVKLFSIFSKKVLKPITIKTRTRIDDVVYDSLEAPILFALALIGIWIAFHRLTFSDGVVKAISDAYKMLVVINFTWFFARLVDKSIETFGENLRTNGKKDKNINKMTPVIRRILLVLVWIIGLVTALSNAGVNISALLGTLGIGGIAFALAAQDTVKNVFGAFTIFTDRPFTIGDTVRIDSFEGTIIDVGIRSTKMRDYNKRVITFPNYKIVDASIVNITAEPMRRVVMKIGLTYNTTSDKMVEAMTILRDMSNRIQYVSPNGLVANFTDFGDSALVITFVYFIEKKADIASTTSNVNMEILSAFNNAGLNFAFPTQTVYVEGLSAQEIKV